MHPLAICGLPPKFVLTSLLLSLSVEKLPGPSVRRPTSKGWSKVHVVAGAGSIPHRSIPCGARAVNFLEMTMLALQLSGPENIC